MTGKKPIASLSLDLDNLWSYMKMQGDPGWESFPSYLDVVVPRILRFLKERDLVITFFVVGQDAALAKNREAIGRIAAAGHEIGNHSFLHEPWLHRYSEQHIETEIVRAEEHIERAAEQKPVGFRGPGFSLSEAILRVLVHRGYLYDASTFPTFLGPLGRAYFLRTTTLSEEQRRQRQAAFGTLRDGFRPINPYRWQMDRGTLIEIPVTTMPVFRLPIHLTYILYLHGFAPALALGYFRAAMKLCQLTGTPPSLLLHPSDFLGRDDTYRLSLPGMQLSSNEKMKVVGDALSWLSARFAIVPLHQHAASIHASHARLVTRGFPQADLSTHSGRR